MPATSSSPWRFVPTLYFAEGVPYVVVNSVSVILYKDLGVANDTLAFWTSLLYLPWVVKMLWGPLVDTRATKRRWILGTQVAMAGCLAALAVALGAPSWFAATLVVFSIAAFVSATHDVAADGFYLHALDARAQAYFVGVRTLFYRAAMIFGSGLLVVIAGRLAREVGVVRAWTVTFAAAAALYAGLWAWHRANLPHPASDDAAARAAAGGGAGWGAIFASWLRQPRVGAVIAFALLYRLGEAMLLKLAAPFLLDDRLAGGLHLTTAQVGVAYGTVGLGCLILGGVIGGWLIGRFGLRRLLWPLALALNVPHAGYLYLAHVQPGPALAYPLVALEQLGYGLGTTAFTVVLMRVSRGEHRTSHFAIATGLMALGMMLPGMVSGEIQTAIGYRSFFLAVLLCGLPGLATLLFLPRAAFADDERPPRG